MWASMPRRSAACLPPVLAALALFVAAAGPISFSWPAAAPSQRVTARTEVRHEHAGARSAGLRQGGPWLSTEQTPLAMDAMGVGLGVCLVLWGSGLLHTRVRARAGHVGCHAAD